MKKLTLMAALLVLVASFAMAQDAATPKVGIEFLQRMDGNFIDGAISSNEFSGGTDGAYSRTEIKAKAAFKFGSFSLTPWIKDRLEGRYNPGDLEGVDPETEKLGKIRIRNRFYAGLDNSYTISEALTIGVNLEWRVANDLRTDKSFDATADEAALPEYRFNPALTVSGKISGFYYSLTQGVPFYFDTSVGDWDNDEDNLKMELEGAYNLGYETTVGAVKLVFDLCDELIITMPENEVAGDEVPEIFNYFDLKAKFGLGAFTPALGFRWVMVSKPDTDPEESVITDQVFGGTIGAAFKKDNWSLGVTYGFGVNTAEDRDSRVESYVTTALKVKF